MNIELNGYSSLRTADGSYTIISPLFEEAMHSVEGAMFESLNRHVLPSGICEKSGPVTVLDICFGLGYNTIALLKALRSNPPAPIHVYAAEFDVNLGCLVQSMEAPSGLCDEFEIIKQTYRDGYFCNQSISIELFRGDSRQLVKRLSERKSFVDAVFHDPHSPSKNCELWSRELFTLLREIVKEEGVLTTYSSALHARCAMIEAGLFISQYKSNLMKEGTLAFKKNNADCIKSELIQEILNNPKSTPFRDDMELLLDRDVIRERRRIEMSARKKNQKQTAAK